jgi:hypothetical protein
MKAKRHPIALSLPQAVALLIVYGRHVVQKMTNNDWFLDPDPTLPVVTDHIDKLEVAQATAKGRAKGSAAARDDAEKLVVDDMNGLKGYVGKVVSQNPGHEAAIIESSGMKKKGFKRPSKAPLAAFLGPNLGEISVVAKAAKQKGSAYEWQCSTDGGTTWVTIGTTTVANTSLLGATAGTTYLFRFRTTRKRTTSDWSATVRLAVH